MDFISIFEKSYQLNLLDIILTPLVSGGNLLFKICSDDFNFIVGNSSISILGDHSIPISGLNFIRTRGEHFIHILRANSTQKTTRILT